MSDTITPEERAKWRGWAKPSTDGQTIPEHVQILRLLDALEAAEARAKDNSDALTAAYMSGKYDGRKEAEAEVARLTKERDWLASEHIKLFELMYPHRKGLYTPQTMIDEAARKAVAGEGK